VTFNLSVILTESARRAPDKTAVIFGDRKVGYAELNAAADRAAGALLRHASPGDRVALMLPNRVEFLECYFGILKAGLVAVPMNPLLKAGEVAHILADSGARVVIAGDLSVGEVEQDVLVLNPDRPDYLGVVDPLPWAASTSADDTAVIIYTSGTTGRPKGAELTHFQLYLNCSLSGERFDTQPDDVALAVLPFFHVYGLSSVVNVSIRRTGTIVAVPRFEPKLVLDAMAAHRVSVLAGVPTMYHALLHADTSGYDLSALRIGSCGGASMPEAVLKGVEEKFGITVLEGYGLSETGSTATMNPSVDDRRLLSIGKPIWGVDVRVAATDTGGELPVGEIGEILVRGHVVMKGYHNNPEATAAAITDGWLHTGDLGYRDADGFLYVVDRIKDLIIRGGFNVYPREVEEVLYGHPAVAEAAVVGRPDERLGEEIVAVLALKPGASFDTAELIAYCRERLADYKCPREVRLLDVLPKSATGKLLKRELRTAV